MSLADRPVLPANSTVSEQWRILLSYPGPSEALSASVPSKAWPPTPAPHPSPQPWASAAPSATVLMPHQPVLSPLIPKEAPTGRSNFPLHTTDPGCILFTAIYFGTSWATFVLHKGSNQWQLQEPQGTVAQTRKCLVRRQALLS